MTNAVEKRSTPRYTEAEKQRALAEVAACSGNTDLAARNLKADESAPNIDQKTLWRWSRRLHVDTYERLRRDQLPIIQAQAAEEHMALARQQMALTAQAGALIASRLPQMEDRDLVNAMGKADIGSGIHTEKAQLLSGLPTQRVARSSEEILREFEAEGLRIEAIEAEVVEEETVATSVDVAVPVADSGSV